MLIMQTFVFDINYVIQIGKTVLCFVRSYTYENANYWQHLINIYMGMM